VVGRKMYTELEGTYYQLDIGGAGFIPQIRRLLKNSVRRVVEFEKDYLGQSKVELRQAHIGAKSSQVKTKAEAIANWTKWLENNPSKITDLDVAVADQNLIEAISKQPQIERLTIEARRISDLSPLRNLPNLSYLQLEEVGADLDFSPLAKMKNLKVLHVHSRKTLRFETMSGLKQLDGLWIGSGIDPGFVGHTIKVENLNFLLPLKQLKRLRIDEVRPLDRDFSALLTLKNLEQAWYVYFRGQHPTPEEMAKMHPAFVGVYENRLVVEEQYSKSRALEKGSLR